MLALGLLQPNQQTLFQSDRLAREAVVSSTLMDRSFDPGLQVIAGRAVPRASCDLQAETLDNRCNVAIDVSDRRA
jgi:hypothetical protein